MPINFEGDQDQFDRMPEEWKDHFMKAVIHQAGYGPHPGKYKGPTKAIDTGDPTEAELASERFQEQGPAMPAAEPGALPPQEQLQQPPMGGGKKKAGGSKPTGTTPTALGVKAVQPQEPEGDY